MVKDMQRPPFVLLAILIWALSVGKVSAEEKETGWSTALEFGAVFTSGNSQAQTFNGKTRVALERVRWSHELLASALRSTQEGNETAERYTGQYQLNFALTERDYLFALARIEHDAFSGFRYQAVESAGYGRRLWDSATGHLEIEVGGGLRQNDLEEGDTENEGIWRGGLGFLYILTDNTKLTEDYTVEASDNRTDMESVTALSVRMTEVLALNLSFTVLHATNPPPQTKQTDTISAITLSYEL